MITATDQKTRHISAWFQNETSLVLLKFTARCALSELFEFELTLLQSHDSKPVDPTKIIGLSASVMVQMPNEDKPREYFGVIRELRQERWTSDGVTYVAKMVPSLWFLTQRNNCRIFQEKDTQEIVEKVLRDAGISDFSFRLSGQYSKREYCVQYRETDFNFISRLLEEEGIFYWFKHEGGVHSINFCDANSHYYKLDVDTIHFPKPGNTMLNRHEILKWQERFQFIPGSVSQKDFNFKEPNTPLLLQRRVSSVQLPQNGACEVYDYHGRYDDESTGLHLTEVRMGELEKDYETGTATSNLAFIHPGGKFKFGTHRMSNRREKEYAVTAIEIEARSGNYSTGSENEVDAEIETDAGTDLESVAYYKNVFTCIPVDRVFRPTRRATRPFVQGLQTAIVTTNGDEIMVDEHGRVKVQFHWDRYGKYDDRSSCWMRVSQVHAGDGFGMIDIPRRNEEVIVSFIEGDPDRPIITGRVYNGANRPPYDLKEGKNGINKTRRGNATKSIGKDKGSYNEMTMDDTPGAEQVRIHGQYNMDTTVENDQTVTVNNNRTKTIAVNETNSIGVDQVEDVGNNRTTSIAVNDTETVGVNQSVSVGTNQSISVGSMKNETVGMISNEMVGVAKTTNVGVANSIIVGAAMNTAIGFLSAEEVGMTKKVMVGNDFSINVGNSMSISAGAKIELTCGASKLTMESGGKVTIEGTAFLFSASGNVKINGSIIDLN